MVMIVSSISIFVANESASMDANILEGSNSAAVEESTTPTEDAQSQTPAAQSETPAATEPAQEAAPETPAVQEVAPAAEAQPVYQEAMQLKHEFTDVQGAVVATIIADIPEGTFQAASSEVTMDVTEVDANTDAFIKTLMEKNIPEDKILGDYFLYNINFLVNGQITEPGREIKITFERQNYLIGDAKKANTFYYNAANSVAGNTEAEIVEVTQKADLIEYFQSQGTSTDNIDDYDLSEVYLNADGTANQIQVEGRRSTVYGCYLEEEKPVKTLTYENDDVTITVDADAEDIIPAGSSLQVVPIVQNDGQTAAQYNEVKSQLEEKVKDEEYDIAGFLAYDISFIDKNGNKVEPNGEVKVTMDYKQEAIPEEVNTDDSLDVTVMHLEENNNGSVKEVVDMVADESKVAVVETTGSAEVTKAEFVTDSFSVYTITWTRNYVNTRTVNFHYVDTSGNDIGGKTGTGKLSGGQTIDLTNRDDYELEIDGYTHKITTVDTYDNTVEVTSITRNRNDFSYNDIDWYGSGNNTYDVYFVYESISGGGSTGGGIVVEPEPTLEKRAIQVSGESNNYNLELDVSSSIGSLSNKAKLDVLLIFDRSGSMNQDVNGHSTNNSGFDADNVRMDLAQDAANNLVKTLDDNKNLDVKYSLVSFSGPTSSENNGNANDARIDIDGTWTSSADTMKTKINALNASGGTNYEAAFTTTKTALQTSSGRTDATQIVIFLTDGEPTVYNGGGAGSGNTTEYADVNKAKTALAGITEAEQFYSIGFGLSFTNSSGIPYTVLKALTEGGTLSEFSNLKCNGASAATKKMYTASSKSALEEAFRNIATNATTVACKNVVVKDTLSDNIEASQETTYQLQISRKATSASAETVVVYQSPETAWGTEYTLPTNLQGVSGHYNGTVDAALKLSTLAGTKLVFDDKTITCTYPTAYELSDKYTYSIIINKVVVTQETINSYSADETYPNTADPSTGTHAGQQGFFSNKNEDAVMNYTVNSTAKNKNFPKPVVQVDPNSTTDIPENPNPTDGSLTKEMGAVTEDGKYPITLQVKTRLEETSEAAKVDVVLLIDVSGSMSNDSRLAQTKTAAKAFVNGFVGPDGSVSTIHRVGIATFSSYGRILKIDNQYFSGNVDEIKRAIEAIDADGGTNTEDGLLYANKLASKSENAKYVIFLTDGVPTRRNNTPGTLSGGNNSETGDSDNTTNDSDGSNTSVAEYNQAVDAAQTLKSSVRGIYTIGLLNGMSGNANQLNVARRLLASSNKLHQSTGYTNCYKPVSGTTGDISEKSVTWNTSTNYTYSNGYFEITSTDGAQTQLQSIWTELATIINNSTSGSTGDGWQVTDKMADYTNFLALDGADMNGHTLRLSDDKKTLTTEIEGNTVTIATYDSSTKVLTWTMNSALATQSVRYHNGIDYTYTLTYYVDFSDSGNTEFRKTNAETYVTTREDDKKIYPPTMPFFVNAIGEKIADGTTTKLAGAKFKVYRNADKTGQIGSEIETDGNGHFAFQVGQSDLTANADGTYTMTVYIEETQAPHGYVQDSTLHAVTINVTNVSYTNQGIASGTAFLGYTTSGDNDLLSLTDNNLKITYSNKETYDWGIVKVSANSEDIKLSGAEFELYKLKDNSTEYNSTASYRGTSNATGIVDTWTDLSKTPNTTIKSKFILTGTYLMKETKAPGGYAVSSEQWKIVIDSAGVAITSITETGETTVTQIASDKLSSINGTTADGAYFYYKDTPLYDLPSTGGSGIFWYLIGGVLLMMAAALILYRKNGNCSVP